MCVFEFDDEKSRANLAKHGIDFVDAQALWLDKRRFEVDIDRHGETRSLVTGMIAGKPWTAVITIRGSAIRIISVRRAWPKEVRAYDKKDD